MFLRFLFCFCAVLTLNTVRAQNFENLNQSSILICKDSQCVPSSDQMGHKYLVNQVNELMKNNIGKNISICEASAGNYTCSQQGLSFPVQSELIQTTVNIPTAKIIDAKALKNEPGADLILDYRLRAGDTFPQCQTSLTRIGIAHAADIKIMSPRFNCKVTETSKTTFSITYNVNYLDLDRGIIGAFYTIAANNALKGTQGGYVLMALEKGVQMEPGETFPYVAQLEAILNGSMPQINDPKVADEMEAFWLKPTPFLNLSTPQFAPNNCVDFIGGCSAEMLNNPAVAVPPTEEQLKQLTPAGVPATIGLIQQKIEIKNESKVLNNPASQKPVSQQTTLTHSEVLSKQMMKNGEKEYRSLKQFEKQNAVAAPVKNNNPSENQQTATTNASPEQKPETSPTPVQILTQPGVTLSADERAYIESLAKSAENQPIPGTVDAKSDLKAVIIQSDQIVSSESAPHSANNAPIVQAPVNEPIAPVYVVPSQNIPASPQSAKSDSPVVISGNPAPVKEDNSIWTRFKRNVLSFF